MLRRVLGLSSSFFLVRSCGFLLSLVIYFSWSWGLLNDKKSSTYVREKVVLPLKTISTLTSYLHPFSAIHPTSYVHFMTQLTIFFENVQMWEEVWWSRVRGRKPRQELQRKRSHEELQMIVYMFHGLNNHVKNLHGISHIFPDIFCCKTWRMVRNGADWLNLVLPWIICIKVYLYTVQGHQLFLWRHGDIYFSCFVMMTVPCCLENNFVHIAET